MSKTKVFHTFEYEGRTITFCIKTEGVPVKNLSDVSFESKDIFVGYAVCMKGDTYKEDLGRTIAEGRAEKNPCVILPIMNVLITRGLLKQILKDLEVRLKNGFMSIKGIR